MNVSCPGFGASAQLPWQKNRQKSATMTDFYAASEVHAKRKASGMRGRAYAGQAMSFEKALSRSQGSFLKPDNRVPGPGAFEACSPFSKPKKQETRKGKPDLGDSFKSERSTTAPSTVFPGPDEYQSFDSINFSMSASVDHKNKSYRDHSRAGFGSETDRWHGTTRPALKGSYDIEQGSRAQGSTPGASGRSPAVAGGSCFRSSSARLPSFKSSSPGPGAYPSEADTTWRTGMMGRRVARKEHLSFGSSRDRFGGLERSKAPGPGTYEIAEPRSPGAWGLVARGPRSDPTGPGTSREKALATKIGPGTYETGGTLLKNTLNTRLGESGTSGTSVY